MGSLTAPCPESGEGRLPTTCPFALLVFVRLVVALYPVPVRFDHGVSHHFSTPFCTTPTRHIASTLYSTAKRSFTSHTRLCKLVSSRSTSTVNHGAFFTGPAQCRTTATGVSTTVSYWSRAQQQGRRWQATTAAHGPEEVRRLREGSRFP